MRPGGLTVPRLVPRVGGWQARLTCNGVLGSSYWGGREYWDHSTGEGVLGEGGSTGIRVLGEGGSTGEGGAGPARVLGNTDGDSTAVVRNTITSGKQEMR